MAGIQEIMKLRQQIIDLGYEITGDIDHGECFYELDMLNEFNFNLDRLKELSLKYYKLNQEEIGE